MPSKKRKYNARFPAGRIKKIMQTDEEVGKVAQAVPIIISRTLELFVESLLKKAMQVTMARNAKTLSPSHVKQCILAESRFDFLRDLVKNIPDVSAAEEKEMMSAESSPNSSRFSDMSVPPRKIAREDSNSSSSCDLRTQQGPRDHKRDLPVDTEPAKPRPERTETVTSTIVSTDGAIDLSKKKEEKPRMANFYQETLIDQVQHKSVITVNPTYTSPQPSTSSYPSSAPVELLQCLHRLNSETKPDKPVFYLDVRQNNNITKITPTPPKTPVTPVTPILNIDFTKNVANPVIKRLRPLDPVANIVSPTDSGANIGVRNEKKLQRQSSKSKPEIKKDVKIQAVNIDHLNSGNLQIDEDYDT